MLVGRAMPRNALVPQHAIAIHQLAIESTQNRRRWTWYVESFNAAPFSATSLEAAPAIVQQLLEREVELAPAHGHPRLNGRIHGELVRPLPRVALFRPRLRGVDAHLGAEAWRGARVVEHVERAGHDH